MFTAQLANVYKFVIYHDLYNGKLLPKTNTYMMDKSVFVAVGALQL